MTAPVTDRIELRPCRLCAATTLTVARCGDERVDEGPGSALMLSLSQSLCAIPSVGVISQ